MSTTRLGVRFRALIAAIKEIVDAARSYNNTNILLKIRIMKIVDQNKALYQIERAASRELQFLRKIDTRTRAKKHDGRKHRSNR